MKNQRSIRKVESAHQSPMNQKRWRLMLDRGHESWITANRWPARKTARCAKCELAAKEGRQPL